MRHACDQGDGLEGYSWAEYDPREGGVQVIKDTPNNVKLTTEFLKVPGGDFGGSWAARIKGEPINPGARNASNCAYSADVHPKPSRHAFRPYSIWAWRALAELTWRRRKTRM